jgi:hypothetical protein
MERHRNYQITEDFVHPITGAIIIKNALWQVYSTETLIGQVNDSTMLTTDSRPTAPTILQTTLHKIKAPNHLDPAIYLDSDLTITQATFHCKKFGIGTFLVMPVLPVTTKLALDPAGNLRLTRDLKDPTLHVCVPAPKDFRYVYTLFHSGNAPRLELMHVSVIDNICYFLTAYPAFLPNCSNDGSTCIGDIRQKVESCKTLALPLNVITDVIFAQFNNDLFPSSTNIHIWNFPSKSNVFPTHRANSNLTSTSLKLIWQTVAI